MNHRLGKWAVSARYALASNTSQRLKARNLARRTIATAVKSSYTDGKSNDAVQKSFTVVEDNDQSSFIISSNSPVIQHFLNLRRHKLTAIPSPFLHASKDRKFSDSFCEIVLPFLEDPALFASYQSIFGGIRFGKLLADLDALAATIGYLHCDDLNLTLLTAVVDRIDILMNLNRKQNVLMRGSVTYVGTSSMEITVSIEATDDRITETQQSIKTITTNKRDSANWNLVALAKLVMVARTPDGKKAVPIGRLIPENDREREMLKDGKERSEWRKRRAQSSLYLFPPTENETKVLHDLFLGVSNHNTAEHNSPISPVPAQDLLAIPDASLLSDSKFEWVPMKNTITSTIRVCHPQERNIHNIVFGGYLIQEAYELAYSNACLFFKQRPCFQRMDDLHFVHPVPIGSIISLTAQVVYSKESAASDKEDRSGVSLACVDVRADVIDVKSGSRKTTNTFHFTLTASEPMPAPKRVYPESYLEGLCYLDAKRRIDLDNVPWNVLF